MTTTSADIPTGAYEQLAAAPRGMQVCSGQVCPRCRQPAYVSGVSWLGRSWTECLARGDTWTAHAPHWNEESGASLGTRAALRPAGEGPP